MQDQNAGHADPEGNMLSFMPEYLHSQDSADAAAENGGQKKCFFRNAPFMPACLCLINSHEQKGKEIDNDKINCDNSSWSHL